jgi:hypothetical protein
MNFKQFFTEALEEPIDYNRLTFILKNIAWMDNRTGTLSQKKINDNDREVFCLKDIKGGTWWAERMPYQHYRIIQKPYWYKREVGGYKRGIERNDFRKKLEFDIIPKIVRYHQAGLTPDQASTAIKI